MEPMTSPEQGWQSQKDLDQGMKVGTRQGQARRGPRAVSGTRRNQGHAQERLIGLETPEDTQADSQGRKGGEQGGWMTRNKMLFDRGGTETSDNK